MTIDLSPHVLGPVCEHMASRGHCDLCGGDPTAGPEREARAQGAHVALAALLAGRLDDLQLGDEWPDLRAALVDNGHISSDGRSDDEFCRDEDAIHASAQATAAAVRSDLAAARAAEESGDVHELREACRRLRLQLGDRS